MRARAWLVVVVGWALLSFGVVVALQGVAGDGAVGSGTRPGVSGPASRGVPAEHTERNARMTSQMRSTPPTAGMRARMAADPTWDLMRERAHVRAEEEHHRRVDRMLARNG
jgi:hypothetical protein